MAETNNDYGMTLYEACEYLNKSSRTISRYIRRGVLHPLAIKSRQGTLEYRFSKVELEAIKKENDETRQVEFDNDLPNYVMPVAAQFANAPFAPAANPQVTFVPNVDFNTTGVAKKDVPDQPIVQKSRPDAEPSASQDTTVTPTKDKDIISLMKETTDMLRGQLQVKDDQIKALGDKIDQLIERGRETNILLKGMQDKILRLGQPVGAKEETGTDVKREEIVMSDVPATVVQPATAPVAQNVAKPKKRSEKDSREKSSKAKTQNTKTNFFGRLFG